MCGLKLVAGIHQAKSLLSHPSWVCGLKLLSEVSAGAFARVTPFVGVWIETPLRSLWLPATAVTPFVGVWIETDAQYPVYQSFARHTLRGCVD